MNIIDAAAYLVYLSYNQKKCSLTPLKLQKLLYLSQGWSYVWDKRALFSEEFEAWQYGPVNTKVYNLYREYGRFEIPESEGSCCKRMSTDEKETLEAVWESYAGYSAFELVELTHEQKPWREAYKNNEYIKNNDIKKFFQSTY